jgi:hypothetical protein
VSLVMCLWGIYEKRYEEMRPSRAEQAPPRSRGGCVRDSVGEGRRPVDQIIVEGAGRDLEPPIPQSLGTLEGSAQVDTLAAAHCHRYATGAELSLINNAPPRNGRPFY